MVYVIIQVLRQHFTWAIPIFEDAMVLCICKLQSIQYEPFSNTELAFTSCWVCKWWNNAMKWHTQKNTRECRKGQWMISDSVTVLVPIFQVKCNCESRLICIPNCSHSHTKKCTAFHFIYYPLQDEIEAAMPIACKVNKKAQLKQGR